MLELTFQYFGHLMQKTDSLENTLFAGKDWRQKEKGMTEDEMVEWHHWLDGYEFEQVPGVGDGQGSLACCSSWGHKESDTTEWLSWTDGADATVNQMVFWGAMQGVFSSLVQNWVLSWAKLVLSKYSRFLKIINPYILVLGFPGGSSGKEPTYQCRRLKRHVFHPWVGRIPWRRAWQPTPVFLPGESHGHRSLEGCSP